MSFAEAPRERDRGLDRYLTFVDAVVAIAITLLVLPLTELGADLADDQSVADLLGEHKGEIWSFLLSFLVIANIWFLQHRALRSLVALNGLVMRMLLLWLLAIVLLPFFTELVAAAPDDRTTKVLYFGAITAASACVAVIEMTMRRNPDLVDIGDGTAAARVTGAWVNVGLLIAAAVLSIAVPALSYYPLLLLLADNLVLGLRRRGGAGRPALSG
ncbi:Uncharacterized membrane protein [Nocardioides terrae]|uniref:Uncharacterized membrane protein n=1 Tax=Nocardioides terrae TaxID=574651 RepID=A0A1I1EIE6_9ACTN|nr:TMEM175 family protein [Nocardioides terrae]SFB86817.1 Uncharacterized membrane protein [Nocardioides terrae]